MPSNLLPGEPLCSPQTTVLLESTVQLLRRLHQSDQWLPHINQHIHSHLELIGGILREEDSRSFKSLGQKHHLLCFMQTLFVRKFFFFTHKCGSKTFKGMQGLISSTLKKLCLGCNCSLYGSISYSGNLNVTHLKMKISKLLVPLA